MRNLIHIFLWGEEIGALEWKPSMGRSYFTYNPAYLAKGGASIAPLMAPIDSNTLYRSFGSEEERIYQRLPAFIADSLPDDWGNTLFEHWRMEQHLAPAEVTPLDKLMFIGKRGMGALEFEPDAQLMPYAEPVNIGELAHLAQKIFVDREEAHIAPDEEITKQLLMAVGTSAGGRQPKAIIAVNRKTGEIRSGQIAGLDGFDYFILKFGDKERSSAELEMTYYEMARAAGIDMMPCFIKEADGEKHFMTQRFDRPNGQKQHTQTLAAMDPDADSYGALMLTCRKLHLPDAAMDEIFRRMVFNYLANNTDDHHKNFAFMMNHKGEWAITPAYDMTFIFNVRGYQPELNHCLSLRGKRSDWTMEDVLSFANENGIRNPEKIIRQVAAAVMNFRALAEKNEVKPEWIGRIEDVLLTHLREWGFEDCRLEIGHWRLEDGREVTNVYLEQAYKGNIHLYATIDGTLRRWIFRPSMPEYALITEQGIANISQSQLKQWVEERLNL